MSRAVSRRIEDKIRKLCQQAVEESDSAKAQVLLHQLQAAIHAHVEKLRERMTKYPVPLLERRAGGYGRGIGGIDYRSGRPEPLAIATKAGQEMGSP
jgi:hypothetical protein